MKEKKDSSNKKGEQTSEEDGHKVRKAHLKHQAKREKVSLLKKILAIILSILLIFVFFLAIVLTSPFIHF